MLPVRTIAAIALALLAQGAMARAAEPLSEHGHGRRVAPTRAFTFACGAPGVCPSQAAPSPPDRAVHPFEGTLGRPCGYRQRATPEGIRRVRVCY